MSSRTILIVDDNPTNLKLACDLLTYEHFAVIGAANADEALKWIADSTPDLILMDLELPGMDGLTLTRQLKADRRYSQIPIVAMTAYAMKGDDQKAFAAGCDGYIAKPINVHDFPRQISSFLRRPALKRR